MGIVKMKSQLNEFTGYLKNQEYSENSIKCYKKDVSAFIDFIYMLPRPLKKEHLIDYKAFLVKTMRPASVNRKIAALNKFFKYLDMNDFLLKTLKIQEQITFDNELGEEDFNKLINTAFSRGKSKIALIMLTLACTGLRISELEIITVEAVRAGRTEVYNKGTIRTVLLQKELQQHLSAYCEEQNIRRGAVFVGNTGNPISRSYVAHSMKEIAKLCEISPAKVFPHNFRHYFARSFLTCGNHITDLADILGHKSINTTRQYLKTNATAKLEQLSRIKALNSWRKPRSHAAVIHASKC